MDSSLSKHMHVDIDNLASQIAENVYYQGWIAAPEGDSWLLETYGVILGKRNGSGWDKCKVPCAALNKMNERWGEWVWELSPMVLQN